MSQRSFLQKIVTVSYSLGSPLRRSVKCVVVTGEAGREAAGVSRHSSARLKRRTWLTASLDVFFDIADALEVDPADLINASVFPDRIIKSK